MVHAEIHWRHFIARGAPGSFPLDDLGQAPPQPVIRSQEGLAVGPGGVELGVVSTAGAETGQALPHLG